MKNKRGSTIVWAITLIMVLSVVVATSLSFAYINYNKVIQDKTKTQAELMAQSVADAIVNQISQATLSKTYEDQQLAENIKKLIPENKGDIIKIDSKDITLSNKKMGKVDEVTITRNQNNLLTITVSVTYAHQSTSIDVTMKKENDENQWHVYKYKGVSS